MINIILCICLIIMFVVGLIFVIISANSYNHDGLGVAGIFFIIIGIIGFAAISPKKTYTVKVTTEKQVETFNDCRYDIGDTYITIYQDNEKIIIYNPIKVEEVE